MIIGNALVEDKLCNIVTQNGKIKQLTNENLPFDIDACGKRVIAGLIDVHTHGCIGLDTMDASLEKICIYQAEHGTTSFLPTAMTMDFESLKKVDESVGKYSGANILGIHYEGPYINKKYKGAQNEVFIKNPDTQEFKQLKNAKMVTVAPELDGAMEFIREISKDCVVSIGHTDCDYETALTAIENGANCLTHTFNAMPPLLHRNAGPIGAAVEKHIYAQLICDGFHISKPTVLAAYRMFGADRLTLISDSVRPAGLPDGEYESGGLKVFVKDKTVRLSDGTIAGSYATLWDCVKKAVEFGIPFNDAVKMATSTPAEMLGVKKGKIAPDFDADLLIIDDDLNIETVIINGEIFGV